MDSRSFTDLDDLLSFKFIFCLRRFTIRSFKTFIIIMGKKRFWSQIGSDGKLTE